MFEDAAVAVRVYNEGHPLQLSAATLHFRRWSRFYKATGAALPHLVDIELRGIPAHAWELETAEHLLDEWVWVRELHPDTLARRDYSVFRLSAWCVNPELLPAVMDLSIVEAPVLEEESPPVKRTLDYPVSIVSRQPVPPPPPTVDPPPPPPSAGDGGDSNGRRRRRQESQSPGSNPGNSADASTSRGKAARLSVHARLGPRPTAECHMPSMQTHWLWPPRSMIWRRWPKRHICRWRLKIQIC